jgi:hypothetical protein
VYKQLSEVRVGNVYKAKASGPRGWRAGTCYWLVVSVRPETSTSCGGCHMLGLNKEWEIVSSTSYGLRVMQERPVLFRMKSFNILKGV